MINKKDKILGYCLFCGEPIKEYSYGWGCVNKQCKSTLYKNDQFFRQIVKRPLTKSKAVALLTGEKLEMNNIVVDGEKHAVSIKLSHDPSGVYSNKYIMRVTDRNIEREDRNYAYSLDSTGRFIATVSAFDILNGD